MFVWDVAAGEKVSEFDTGMDFGGRRLAISADGERVVTGAYHRHGVEAWEAETGRRLWQRKDLKKVQHISVILQAEIFASLQDAAGVVLNMESGKDVRRIRGVGDMAAAVPLHMLSDRLRVLAAKLREEVESDSVKFSKKWLDRENTARTAVPESQAALRAALKGVAKR